MFDHFYTGRAIGFGYTALPCREAPTLFLADFEQLFWSMAVFGTATVNVEVGVGLKAIPGIGIKRFSETLIAMRAICGYCVNLDGSK
jgi:hypothetical protein